MLRTSSDAGIRGRAAGITKRYVRPAHLRVRCDRKVSDKPRCGLTVHRDRSGLDSRHSCARPRTRSKSGQPGTRYQTRHMLNRNGPFSVPKQSRGDSGSFGNLKPNGLSRENRWNGTEAPSTFRGDGFTFDLRVLTNSATGLRTLLSRPTWLCLRPTEDCQWRLAR